MFKNMRVGARVAERVSNLLDEFAASIAKTSDMVQEIVTAFEEHLTVFAQINTTKRLLKQNTQQNTTSPARSTNSTKEMSCHPEQLQHLMKSFVLVSANAHEHAGIPSSQHGDANDVELLGFRSNISGVLDKAVPNGLTLPRVMS